MHLLYHDKGEYMGLKTLTMENWLIKVLIAPDDGGRIIAIIDKASGHNFIWNNERTITKKRMYGVSYDDLMAGGIEEAFPTGLTSFYKGDQLPFFGEVWAVPWSYELEENSQKRIALKLECFCAIYAAKIVKVISIEDESLNVRVDYKIKNVGPTSLDFIMGIHPSININPDCIFEFPKAVYHIGSAAPEGVLENKSQSFNWPMLEGMDMSRPKTVAAAECINVYTTSADKGEITVYDTSKDLGILVEYDEKLFEFLGVWPIYGGWRGHYCLMFEFFTGWPVALHEAVENGRYNTISSGEELCTSTEYRIFKKNI